MSYPQMITKEQAEAIRDCLYLADTLIFKQKLINNPYPETLREEIVESAIASITGEYHER